MICFNTPEKSRVLACCHYATFANRWANAGGREPGSGMGEFRTTSCASVSRIGAVNLRNPPQSFPNLMGKSHDGVGCFRGLCYPTASEKDA